MNPPLRIDLLFTGIFMDTDLIATQLPLMLEEWQSTTGWQPGATQLLQFQNFFDLVCLANKSLNLTRILEPVDFWEKHLWDSLQPVLTKPELTKLELTKLELTEPELQGTYKVIDLGTGGGFPGLPIAIAYPDWAVTVMDSTAKKISFIESGLATLELTNVRTVVDRTESLARNPLHRDVYQLATIRAVAEAAVCAEYAVPFLAIGGTAILYRGRWSEEETVTLTSAVEQLGAKITEISAYKTPLSQGERHCIYIQKELPTSTKFPRAVGTPSQKPLSQHTITAAIETPILPE
jgi:16S rRNA (guanine527-N7)-methyltransferase